MLQIMDWINKQKKQQWMNQETLKLAIQERSPAKCNPTGLTLHTALHRQSVRSFLVACGHAQPLSLSWCLCTPAGIAEASALVSKGETFCVPVGFHIEIDHCACCPGPSSTCTAPLWADENPLHGMVALG